MWRPALSMRPVEAWLGQTAVLAAQSEEDWSWSMRGNLILVGWVRRFRWSHALTALINFSSCFRCPCMCSHVSCTACRNGWHMWYVLTEDIATYTLSILAKTVWQWQSCCVPWQSSKSAVCCLLRLTPWWWIISLVIYHVSLEIQPLLQAGQLTWLHMS